MGKRKINMICKVKVYLSLDIGDWGLGIGDWGLGIGPNPQSPIPQSPFCYILIAVVTFSLYLLFYELFISMLKKFKKFQTNFLPPFKNFNIEEKFKNYLSNFKSI